MEEGYFSQRHNQTTKDNIYSYELGMDWLSTWPIIVADV